MPLARRSALITGSRGGIDFCGPRAEGINGATLPIDGAWAAGRA